MLKDIFNNVPTDSSFTLFLSSPGGGHVGRKLADIQRIQSILVTVYLLELVGATAVTSLGWAACRILQISSFPSLPLWFAGYLLVYNLDRLHPDPADLVNIPVRVSKAQQLRGARIGLASICGRATHLAVINWSMEVSIGTGFRYYLSPGLLLA